ncbi:MULTISPECIES: AMP-binding protein [Mycobacterium avium complex (MAC)]|uniref:AMP-binding protein n=1 Tax=Mycobacterium avium complex (MAC) TaxID=120793 RepID=UPI001F1D910E|nr:AMP-binding protein [Mycobacterium intracellulare]
MRTNARRFGSSPALWNVETGERYTWSELDDRVGRLAGVLSELFGIGVKDRVLLIAEGDTRTFELQFACMRLGAIMVPLNWRLTVPELAELARDVAPTLIVHDDVWQSVAVELSSLAGIAARLSWRCGAPVIDYDDAVAAATPIDPRTDLPLDLPTHILHTSGTTGPPKGALTTAKTLVWQALNTAADAGMTGPGCVLLNPMPLFHAGGLTTVAAPMLMTGGAVATMRRFEAAEVLEVLGDPACEISHFTAPPVMWLMLANQPGFAAADFSQLRFAQIAGGLPAEELLRRWQARGVVLRAAYGGTEMGPGVTTMPAESALTRPGSCGRAVPFSHVRLVGEDGTDVPDGQPGEIWVKGPAVSPGYWQAGRSPVVDRPDGWLHTGDVAWRDADGFFYLVDRINDMYKSGGENVAPAEVERALLTHSAVADVAVVGVPDEHWGEVGRAYVVLAAGASVTLSELREHCRRTIARYKAPRSLVIVDQLPRNSTGKVSRSALREYFADKAVHHDTAPAVVPEGAASVGTKSTL